MASKDGVSPVDTAAWLQHLTFGYGLPLMELGAKRTLQFEDLPSVSVADRASVVVERVIAEWRAEVAARPKSPSLWYTLYRSFRWKFWVSAFLSVVEGVIRVAQAYILKLLLMALLEGDIAACYMQCAFMVLGCFLNGLVHHQLFFITMVWGWNLRVAMIGVLHWKLLRIKTAALQAESAADCSNLVANDVNRFDELMPFFHLGWGAFVEVFMVAALLVMIVGWAPTSAGICIVLLFTAATLEFGKRFARRREITAAITDDRLRTISEVISAVLSVKVYCWEKLFADRVAHQRSREHASIFQRQLMIATTITSFFNLVPMATLALFLVMVAEGRRLRVDDVFAVLGLLMVVKTCLGKHFARAAQTGPECHTSVCRLQRFLLLPEVEPPPEQPTALASADARGGPAPCVWLQDACFAWQGAGGAPALAGVTAAARPGELLVVAGPVGCGKSALLQALLGELRATGGSYGVRGSVAYAAQTPWIMAGTVRSNVLLGAAEEPRWYEEVVRACCLEDDVRRLGPLGHDTEIGERGVNLSGGQKARVGLARAVYARAGTVLLDDPLAAVDPAVAAALVHGCLRGPALAGAAVVLCTHHESVLPLADKVLLLDECGAMRAFGPPEEVAARCGFKLASPTPEPIAEGKRLDAADEPDVGAEAEEEGAGAKSAGGAEEDAPAGTGPGGVQSTTLVKAEGQAKGSVRLGTYMNYMRAGGLVLSGTVLVLYVVSQATLLVSNYWIGVWAAAEDQGDEMYATVFVVITVVTVVLAAFRTVLFFLANLRASSSVHDEAFRHVLATKMGFFTENPHGRILNRFSGDVGNVDELLSQALELVLDMACTGAGTMVLVCITVPFVIPIFAAVCWYMLWLRRFVVKSLTELKRLDSVSKSPVVDSFAASLRGLTSLRAFRREAAAQARMVELLDENAQAWFWWMITNRFMGFRLDLQVVVIMACTTFGGLALRQFVSPELIGLTIVHVISLTGLFQYMVRQSAMVESFMTSFERLSAYAALPNEPDEGRLAVAGDFPARGAIEMKGLCMRYREDLPIVLHGATLQCPGGAKVGLCGRTGSGKSSLFAALARLADITEGRIELDGVDAAALPLRTLRGCISWVPQDPSFFSGSLRSNLDPFEQYADAEVWAALEAVQMASALDAGLNEWIADQGSNFSIGERQLLSLARALLQRRRLLCMDEAFANVDFATDAKVQAAIRTMTEGMGATVLVVAHRLKSLADSDYIVVMDAGTVLEQGPPDELLRRGGAYAELVQQGQAEHSQEPLCPDAAGAIASPARRRASAAEAIRDIDSDGEAPSTRGSRQMIRGRRLMPCLGPLFCPF